MSYQKNSDDNGRIGGTFNDFTTEHIVSKFNYGNTGDNEVVREVTDSEEERIYGND